MQLLTRSIRARWAIVLLSLTACLVQASPASATPPGTNGRIAFMRHDDAGHWQIWSHQTARSWHSPALAATPRVPGRSTIRDECRRVRSRQGVRVDRMEQ